MATNKHGKKINAPSKNANQRESLNEKPETVLSVSFPKPMNKNGAAIKNKIIEIFDSKFSINYQFKPKKGIPKDALEITKKFQISNFKTDAPFLFLAGMNQAAHTV